MTLSRRRFLALGALGAAGAILPHSTPGAPLPRPPGDNRVLVILQLSGGNDGLNTVVPYADDRYHRARPTLRHQPRQVLALDDYAGLHPSLGGLHERWKDGTLAVIPGAGHPEAAPSHFAATNLWHAADRGGRSAGRSWIARLADAFPRDTAGGSPVRYAGPRAPWFLHSDRGRALDVRANDETGGRGPRPYRERADYPATPLARSLRDVAAAIVLDRGLRICSVEMDGFDTHQAARETHDALMRQFGDAVAAFLADLAAQGHDDRVILMAFSEFGRRLAENSTEGTDHGRAGLVLVTGARVRGGVYGGYPSLTDLDEGSLRHTVDFREVYGTIIERWFGVPAARVLGAVHAPLAFLPA